MKWIINFGFIIFFVSSCFISLTTCTFDNEEDLLNDFLCDTIDIVYTDLIYIFTDICVVCHSETFTYNDAIKMDTYENVKSSINSGLVWPAINHAEGAPPMPNGLPKLSECDLNKIEIWINTGMPEN